MNPTNESVQNMLNNLNPEQVRALYQELKIAQQVAQGTTDHIINSLDERSASISTAINNIQSTASDIDAIRNEGIDDANIATAYSGAKIIKGAADTFMGGASLVSGKLGEAYNKVYSTGTGLIEAYQNLQNGQTGSGVAGIVKGAGEFGESDQFKQLKILGAAASWSDAQDKNDSFGQAKSGLEAASGIAGIFDEKAGNVIGAYTQGVDGLHTMQEGVDNVQEALEWQKEEKENIQTQAEQAFRMIDDATERLNTSKGEIESLKEKMLIGNDPQTESLLKMIEQNYPDLSENADQDYITTKAQEYRDLVPWYVTPLENEPAQSDLHDYTNHQTAPLESIDISDHNMPDDDIPDTPGAAETGTDTDGTDTDDLPITQYGQNPVINDFLHEPETGEGQLTTTDPEVDGDHAEDGPEISNYLTNENSYLNNTGEVEMNDQDDSGTGIEEINGAANESQDVPLFENPVNSEPYSTESPVDLPIEDPINSDTSESGTEEESFFPEASDDPSFTTPEAQSQYDGTGPSDVYDGTGPSTTYDGTGSLPEYDGTGADNTYDGTGPESTYDGTGPESTYDGTGAGSTYDGMGGTEETGSIFTDSGTATETTDYSEPYSTDTSVSTPSDYFPETGTGTDFNPGNEYDNTGTDSGYDAGNGYDAGSSGEENNTSSGYDTSGSDLPAETGGYETPETGGYETPDIGGYDSDMSGGSAGATESYDTSGSEGSSAEAI